MADKNFAKLVDGYSLTTAEILYHLPDHPTLLQTYVWQAYDLAPKFPKLRKFLDFWNNNLDGALNRIRIANRRLIEPTDVRFVDGEFKLH